MLATRQRRSNQIPIPPMLNGPHGAEKGNGGEEAEWQEERILGLAADSGSLGRLDSTGPATIAPPSRIDASVVHGCMVAEWLNVSRMALVQ